VTAEKAVSHKYNKVKEGRENDAISDNSRNSLFTEFQNFDIKFLKLIHTVYLMINQLAVLFLLTSVLIPFYLH
jgi:hypothetical protein